MRFIFVCFKMFVKWDTALLLKMFILQLATSLSGWYNSLKLYTSANFEQVSDQRTSNILPSYIFEDISSTINFCCCCCYIFIKKKTQYTIKEKVWWFWEGMCLGWGSCTAINTLLQVLPACQPMLSPACGFIDWDTICHPRHFIFRKFVHELIFS